MRSLVYYLVLFTIVSVQKHKTLWLIFIFVQIPLYDYFSCMITKFCYLLPEGLYLPALLFDT